MSSPNPADGFIIYRASVSPSFSLWEGCDGLCHERKVVRPATVLRTLEHFRITVCHPIERRGKKGGRAVVNAIRSVYVIRGITQWAKGCLRALFVHSVYEQ
jgi:hypothetical protein